MSMRRRGSISSINALIQRLNHGHRHAELEATEAVKWLRAAGFPQYTQMFDDGQFPVDLRDVEKDHDFLDKDSLVSLFRRLETLNKYAGIKLDVLPCKKGTNEEEEEDDTCAISDRWEYQRSSRRWSRKNLVHPSKESTAMGSDQKELESRSCSHDSLLADQESESQTDDSPRQETKVPHIQDIDNHDGRTVVEIKLKDEGQNSATVSPFLSHTGSDRIKSPKNIFSRMEGLKSKKSRRQSGRRNIVEISGPIVADSEIMQARLKKLNCVDITPTSETLHRSFAKGAKADGEVYSDLSVDKYDSKASSGITVTESSIGSTQSAISTKSFSEPVPRLNEASYPQFSHVNHARLGLTTKYTESKDRSSVHHLPLDQDSSLSEHSQTSCATNQQTHREEISTDMSLADVLLATQDYHHEHQNGHVEREACGPAFGSDNTRVSSGVNVAEDHKASSYVINSSDIHRLEHRKSLYDNILSVDDQSMEEGEFRMIFPGIFKLESGENRIQSLEVRSDLKVNSATVEMTKHRLAGDFVVEHRHKNIANISYDSSAASAPGRNLDKRHKSLIMGKSVKFDTTSSSPIPRRSRSPCSTGISSGDPKNGGISGPGSTGLSRPTHHDHSPDFVAGGSGHEPSSKDCPENMPEISLQQDYDDFDRILQQLYQNINDLASFMDEDKPAQQELPHDNSDSLDFDATLDLDQENSFSGGEGSNTAESSSEDQEFGLTDLSQDDGLDQISEISMERRDSGVGHSLTRDQRRKKIRWHSFQKSHRPDINSRAMQINSLSVAQLVRLQKLSLLKLTSIMEKCLPVSKSGWNWMMPRFMKRQRTPDFSTKNVFGVPLTLMAQWTGQPLPQCVLYAMRYLRRTSPHAVGIFRKSGVKSKIQQLRDELEAHPDITNFEGVNAYNVADMLKTYFRDLPECLLTNKMSEIFCSIYMHVPQSQRLEAIQTAIALLPDVNREVLQSILLFLSDISSHEAEHQMNASNLAVCFTPTVFQLGARQNAAYSPKRNHKTSPGVPDPREIMEQKAAHECLLMMITECKKLFTVPLSLFLQLQVQSVSHITPTPLQDIGSSPSDIRAFGQERIQIILKEAHDKNRGWLPTLIFGDVEVFHRKPIDDCPLKEWKLTVDIEAPPIEVLHRIMHERHVWDEDLLNWSVVERLDPHADIFQFVLNSMAPHPSRHFCILRYWRSDLNKGACALITQSVDHIDAMEAQGVTAVDLGTYFLMEPCGSGRSRLTYVTRVDTRGRTPEWYTKIYSHICINFLKRLKESFRQYTSGPETRV